MKIDRLHLGAALVFAASAAITAAWCGSMSGMPGMEMPGGWTMGMAWMCMPGQGWGEYAGMFLGMWAVMMLAMMLPAFMPMLVRYRHAVRAERKGMLMACVAAGYFAVWNLAGLVLFPLGVAFCEVAMRVPRVSELVPTTAALVVLAAGASQFTSWKARQLECCRHSVDCCGDTRSHHRDAWRHGVKIGARCLRCCAGLTAVLLVVGTMDLLAMALVTAAISAERLLGNRAAAYVVGAGLLSCGSVMLARATTMVA